MNWPSPLRKRRTSQRRPRQTALLVVARRSVRRHHGEDWKFRPSGAAQDILHAPLAALRSAILRTPLSTRHRLSYRDYSASFSWWGSGSLASQSARRYVAAASGEPGMRQPASLDTRAALRHGNCLLRQLQSKRFLCLRCGQLGSPRPRSQLAAITLPKEVRQLFLSPPPEGRHLKPGIVWSAAVSQ